MRGVRSPSPVETHGRQSAPSPKPLPPADTPPAPAGDVGVISGVLHSKNFPPPPSFKKKKNKFCQSPSFFWQHQGRRRGRGHAWPRVPAAGTCAAGGGHTHTRHDTPGASPLPSVMAGRRQLVFIAPGRSSRPWAAVGCLETARRRATGFCFAWPVSLALGDGCGAGWGGLQGYPPPPNLPLSSKAPTAGTPMS